VTLRQGRHIAMSNGHVRLTIPRHDPINASGWSGVSEEIRREHRADLYQALAHESLADVAQADTLLLYLSLGIEPRRFDTVATVTSGRRRVRLILASVPFGYRSTEHEEADLAAFRGLLVG